MGAPRQVPMSDPRTFGVQHHAAANEETFGLDDFWAEYQKRDEGYNLVLTQDEHLSHVHERPFTEVNGIQVAQEASDDTISNGTYALNPLSYNICLNGNFDLRPPTDAELHELVQVWVAKCNEWGWCKQDALTRIITHQDAGTKYARVRYETDCPGKYLIAKMPWLCEQVASYLPE
jgi:hypothetical protein